MSGPYHGKMQLAAEQPGTLGMTFCALPPGPLVLNSVVEGTWAEERGLKAGDVVLAVNGSSPSDMSRCDFMDTMRQRPIMLTFDLPAIDVVADEIPKPREEVVQVEEAIGEQDQKEVMLSSKDDELPVGLDTAAVETLDAANVEELKPAEESKQVDESAQDQQRIGEEDKQGEQKLALANDKMQAKEEVSASSGELDATAENVEAVSKQLVTPANAEGGKTSKNKRKKKAAKADTKSLNDTAIGA